MEKSKNPLLQAHSSNGSLTLSFEMFLQDSYPVIREKVKRMVEMCEQQYLQVTGQSFQVTSRTKATIDAFLKMGDYDEERWKTADDYRWKLDQACVDYYNEFRGQLIAFTEQHRELLMNELISPYPLLFKEGQSPIFTQDWIQFPELLPFASLEEDQKECCHNDPDLKTWEDICTDLENGSTSETKEKICNGLANEYKIHLMLKPEWIYIGIVKLLEALNANPELRESIKSFKVTRYFRNIGDTNGKQITPIIVIYPRHMREHAEKALSGLLSFFKPYFAVLDQVNAPDTTLI